MATTLTACDALLQINLPHFVTRFLTTTLPGVLQHLAGSLSEVH